MQDRTNSLNSVLKALLFLLAFPFLWAARYLSIAGIVIPVLIVTAVFALTGDWFVDNGYITKRTFDWIAVAYSAIVTILVITLAIRLGGGARRFWRTFGMVTCGLFGFWVVLVAGFYLAGFFDNGKTTTALRKTWLSVDQKAEAEFILHRRLRRYAIGEVRNLSGVPVNNVSIQSSTAGGSQRYTATFSDYIKPGDSAPVRFLTVKSADGEPVEFTVQAAASYPDPGPPGLSVGEITLSQERSSWTVSGSISNAGEAPVNFVRVDIALWDGEDRLLNVATARLHQDTPLEPGRSSEFSIRFVELDEPAARTTARVMGMW